MRGYDELSDVELVAATRAGDAAAYGTLWIRHGKAAYRAAKSVTNQLDAHDIAQEAFEVIFATIGRGAGPTWAFRPYLLAAVRNLAARWSKGLREVADDDLDSVIDPDWSDTVVEDAVDKSFTVSAFRSLPTRWQEVLWYTVVEDLKPAEVAPLLGMQPAAVAQLAFRARDGLRDAWIRAHLASVPQQSECGWVVEHLGAFARRTASKRDRRRVESHLPGCEQCMKVAEEADQVSSRLMLSLVPTLLGTSGAGAYLLQLREPVTSCPASGPGAGPTVIAHGARGVGVPSSRALVALLDRVSRAVGVVTARGIRVAVGATIALTISAEIVVALDNASLADPAPASTSGGLQRLHAVWVGSAPKPIEAKAA